MSRMDEEAKLTLLLDLAEEIGIAIRRMPVSAEAGDHPGGAMVRLKGKDILFLDPTADVADQVAAVASALRGKPEIADRFLPPEVRELVDGPA